MPKKGLFCRVLKGGEIKKNDTVVFTPRPLRFRVITVSDRACKGQYPDLSGPKVREIMESFFAEKTRRIQIDARIVPDDTAKLTKLITEAVENGIDVVITTGGTGVGPKDITPEVIIALADKTIDGIMDYIRLKYGAKKPNALVSRSIAAVKDKTIIYALPGSCKAVAEYTPEILQTVEHLFFMLHELDTHQ